MITQDNKVTYREEAKQKIDQIFDKLDKWKAKQNEIQENSKEAFQSKIHELESKKEELKSRYQKIENASEEELKEIRKKLNESSEYFSKGFSKLATIVS